MSDLTDIRRMNTLVYTLEQLWEILRHYLKIMVMFQNVSENCVRILEEEKQGQLRMFVIM